MLTSLILSLRSAPNKCHRRHANRTSLSRASNHPYSYPVEHARRTSEAYVNLNANVDAK